MKNKILNQNNTKKQPNAAPAVENSTNYAQLNVLRGKNAVCIISHVNPDVDALASSVVFARFLKQFFKIKQVDLFADFKTLPQNYDVLTKNVKLNPKIKKYQACIMLDAPNASRLGCFEQVYENGALKISIDHHNTNLKNADINIVETVSSTCEIVYSILKSFNFCMEKEDLSLIYAGIITDTNNFSVGAMNARTFKIVAEIVDKIDQKAIYNQYFSNNSLKNMQVLALAIQNIKVFNDGKIIFTHISKQCAERLNIHQQDYEGVINRIATISKNVFVCFVYPKNGCYYVSMRAKQGFDVATIAKANNGGGHVGAAAFDSKKSINSIKNLVLSQFLKQI